MQCDNAVKFTLKGKWFTMVNNLENAENYTQIYKTTSYFLVWTTILLLSISLTQIFCLLLFTAIPICILLSSFRLICWFRLPSKTLKLWNAVFSFSSFSHTSSWAAPLPLSRNVLKSLKVIGLIIFHKSRVFWFQ